MRRERLKPVAIIVVLAAITWANWLAFVAADRARENSERIAKQTCDFTEKLQQQDIQHLEYVYNLQIAMPPKMRGKPTILANLVIAEQNAIESGAPEFCDTPGYGLYDKHPTPPLPPDGIEYHGPGTYGD